MAARYESWNIFSVSFWKKCCRKLTQFEAYGPRNYFFCHLRKLPAWSTFSRTPLSFGSLPTSGSFVPQVSSVAQSCPTLCDCSTPGFLVHHQLLELAQTHVHGVGDAILPSTSSVVPFSCLQSFPASESFPMSQFFPLGGHSIGVSASVLPMNIQD